MNVLYVVRQIWKHFTPGLGANRKIVRISPYTDHFVISYAYSSYSHMYVNVQ